MKAQTALFLHAFKGFYSEILFGMDHRDAALFYRVAELMVTALAMDKVPAILLQQLDYFLAVHLFPCIGPLKGRIISVSL